MAIDPISLAISVALTAASMAITASQTIEGPRLTDLSVTVADYGTPVNYFIGIRRLEVPVFYAEPIHEEKVEHKTKGGKYSEYVYSGTFAVLVADHEVQAYRRIWLDRHLGYDNVDENDEATRNEEAAVAFLGLIDDENIYDIDQVMRFYYGTELQDPDERMVATVEADEGPDTCPAYLGTAYVMFEQLPLKFFGNRFPQVSVEAQTFGSYDADIIEGLLGGFETGLGGYCNVMTSPNGRKSVLSHGILGGARYLTFENMRGAYNVSEVDVSSLSAGEESFGFAMIDNAGNVYATDEANTKTFKITPARVVTQLGSTGDIGSPPTTRFGLFGLFNVEGVDTLVYSQNNGTETGVVYTRPTSGGAPTLHSSIADVGDTLQGRFPVQDSAGNVWIASQPSAAGVINTMYFWCVAGPRETEFQLVTGMPTINSGETGSFIWPTLFAGQIYLGWNTTGAYRYVVAIDETAFTVTRTCNLYTLLGTTSVYLGSGPVCIDSERNHLVVVEYDNESDKIIHRIKLSDLTREGARVSGWLPDVEFDAWIEIPPSEVEDENDDVSYPGFSFWHDPVGGMLALPFDNRFISDFPNPPRWAYPPDFAFLYIDANIVRLRDLLTRVSGYIGFAPSDYDWRQLDQTMYGYSWTQGRAGDIVAPALSIHDSDVRPNGFIQEGLKRGRPLSGPEIREEWFETSGEGALYKITVTGDTDLPRRVSVVYADKNSEQQPNTAVAQRKALSVTGLRELSIDATTYAENPDVMQPLTERYLRRQWIGAIKAENKLTPRHKLLRPADVRNVVFDNEYLRAAAKRVTLHADRSLSVRWERDGAVPIEQITILDAEGLVVTQASIDWEDDTGTTISDTPSSPGAVAEGRPPPHVFAPVDSTIFALDIPLIRDSQDQTTPFLFYAGGPNEDGDWPGVILSTSDSGTTENYALLASIGSTGGVTHGIAKSVLPAAGADVHDLASQLVIQIYNGVLESLTDEEFAANPDSNLLGVIRSDGKVEFVQFRDAVLQSDGEYIVSTLCRGTRGTEEYVDGHAIGDKVILLTSRIGTYDMGAGEIGDTDYYKGVTIGRSSSLQDPQALEFGAVANKPLRVAHLKLWRDVGTGDWQVTWFRRTRIGGASLDGQDVPLGETSELYRIVILDGATVVETYESTDEEFLYTAALQGTDWGMLQTSLSVRVVQVSPMLNLEGFPAEASA